ncbi:MAG: putative metal-binding motif-containing protein [Deltaproteobacteria bacterium]|nr:putative metal-binding motif-containing protein [Deltaproteobacteria bacterium]
MRSSTLVTLAGAALAAAVGCSSGEVVSQTTGTGPTTSAPDGSAGGGTGGEAGTTTTGGGAGGAGAAGGSAGAAGEGGGCNPAAPEKCNGLDDNCNGDIDEGDPESGEDCDSGLPGECAKGKSYCQDGEKKCLALVTPGTVAEECNGLDDDCDGENDNGDPGGGAECATGLKGICATGVENCIQGVVSCEPDHAPGEVKEQCNDLDDDCNGFIDEGVQKLTFFKDNDGDGYGGMTTTLACSAPPGYVADAGDCNDFNKDISPKAAEACNDIDDNCNGLPDDGVPTQKIYKDNDGDGFAAKNALSQDKCNVPLGWTVEKDADGDKKPDWDCNDSDVTVYPKAPTICDGKDNDCDGIVDRLCFTACPGKWPYQPSNLAGSVQAVQRVDLDGDGYQEIISQTDTTFAILDYAGNPLHESEGSLNYSRGRVVVADIDEYDQFGQYTQSLEVLTGNESKATYYKLAKGVVTVFPSAHGVYDASRFMVADIDRDGIVEFFTTSWCNGTQGTRVFRFDRGSGQIGNVVNVPDPDATCEYTDGRMLTDLDGNGVPELVFGNGYPQASTPSTWKGRIYAQRFKDPVSLVNEPFCDPASCFPTAIQNLVGGGVSTMFRIGDEIRTAITYFTNPAPNSPATTRYWAYDLLGNTKPGFPTDKALLWDGITDIDNDGQPETDSTVVWVGLFDLNGDGYPDKIYGSGGELRVDLWDPGKKVFASNSGSTKKVAGSGLSVWALWDLGGASRMGVLSTDANQNLFCHQLGDGTWDRASALPPHFPAYMRSYQWDNYEPNEGADKNADGVPDEVIRIPSALTSRGDFYGYLSSPTDKDYYLVDAQHGGTICLRPPKGKSYTLKIYSFYDKKAPSGPDGLVWQDSWKGPDVKCFTGGSVVPNRNGEFRFVVGVESQGDYSTYWPYWISAPK